MRDIEVIDSELRLLLAIRHMAREAEGRTPNTARIDALPQPFPGHNQKHRCPAIAECAPE